MVCCSNYTERGKTEVFGEESIPIPFICCKSHMLLGRDGFKDIQFLPHIFVLAELNL